MLEGKDLMNLELCVVDGLIDQLTVQESSILHLVRPDEFLVSTGIALEKERLNQIANDLIEQIDAISLAEAIKE